MVPKLVSTGYPLTSRLWALTMFLTASPQTRMLVLSVWVQKALSGSPTADRVDALFLRLLKTQMLLVTLITRVIQLSAWWMATRPPAATEKKVVAPLAPLRLRTGVIRLIPRWKILLVTLAPPSRTLQSPSYLTWVSGLSLQSECLMRIGMLNPLSRLPILGLRSITAPLTVRA